MTEPADREFIRLVETVAALRAPEGCPWDREQTLESLTRYVIEEAYEVVDAVERGDMSDLREEIGDHIFEGVFLAQIAAEQGVFDVADALRTVADKLVRRHPHVFKDDGQVHDALSKERAPSADAALARWDAQKARERADAGRTASALAGIPSGLPALLRAYRTGARAASAGFDWARPADVVDKIEEETAELREVLDAAPLNAARLEEEMGDLLFAIANLARKLDVEPEAALRKATTKFARRFGAMEQRLTATGKVMSEMTPDELEAAWQSVKADEPL
jgi:ATP diphosphatase